MHKAVILEIILESAHFKSPFLCNRVRQRSENMKEESNTTSVEFNFEITAQQTPAGAYSHKYVFIKYVLYILALRNGIALVTYCDVVVLNFRVSRRYIQ